MYKIPELPVCPICKKISPTTGTQAEPGVLCECSKIDLQIKIAKLMKEIREMKNR